MNINTENKKLYAGLFRRLFAISYDCFLLIALLFITTAIFNSINHGKAIESDNIIYIPLVLTLSVITFFFFSWFWMHGGQTLGLKTWRLRVMNINFERISWQQATIRFIAALLSIAFFGLGFIWSLFHKERKTWHDIISKTVVVDLRYYPEKQAVGSADSSQQNN